MPKGEGEWLRRLRRWLWRIQGRKTVASTSERPHYRVSGLVQPEVFGVAACALVGACGAVANCSLVPCVGACGCVWEREEECGLVAGCGRAVTCPIRLRAGPQGFGHRGHHG